MTESQEMQEKPAFDFEAVFEVDDYMHFYQETLTDELSDQQVAHLVREFDLTRPTKILDLACGFGRHANRLAALGHQVTGIDITPGFLEIARQDAKRRGVEVTYLEGDMRQLNYVEEFDRVMLLFTAFGYFEDDENFQVLMRIARALKPGGLLVFDIQNRDTFLKGFLPYIVTEKEGDLLIDRIAFDTVTGRLYNRRIVIRNGIRKDKPFFVRLYNPTEIVDLVTRAGMEIHKMYGGWDDGQGAPPVSTESRRMIIIARKPGTGNQG
jgi:SAM-dependent methyltransferase